MSIGSDAVFSAEELIANGNVPTGKSSIEQISYRYGKQAVVVRARPRPTQTHLQVNSRTPVPQKLTGLVSLYTKPSLKSP